MLHLINKYFEAIFLIGIEKFEQSKASSSGTKRKSTDEKKPVKKLCAM